MGKGTHTKLDTRLGSGGCPGGNAILDLDPDSLYKVSQTSLHYMIFALHDFVNFHEYFIYNQRRIAGLLWNYIPDFGDYHVITVH